MQQLTQITDTLFALPVDSDLENFYQSGLGLLVGIDKKGYRIVLNNEALDSKISIIGTVSTTEIDFDPTNYVESKISGKVLGNCKLFKIYTTGNWSFFALNSFRSLLSSKGITPTNETKVLILEKSK